MFVSIKIIFPNCEYGVAIEDYQETNEPFECENCDSWLVLEINEGTYYGATHSTLKIFDPDYD